MATDTDLPLFLGRQREQELLWRELRQAMEGQTRVVLLSGEPGSGKTRLFSHFAAAAASDGALVLHGMTSDAEGMPPYLPFLEALGLYLRTAPLALLRKQVGMHGPALATLFPEVTQRLGSPPDSYALPPEQLRFRLYEAIALFFSKLCQAQPVLLVLDDLQWADAASLDLLWHIVRHQPPSRLLVLGAVPSGEEGQAGLAHVLAQLDRLRRLTFVELLPLSVEETGELARGYLGALLEPETLRVLYAASEGNPFFSEELLRSWQETGRLHRLGTSWALNSTAEGKFSASILRAVEERLRRLPPETVQRLRSAAIIGRQFEPALLAEVLGEDVDKVEAQLWPALQAALVKAEGSAFAFNHDLIRQVLYLQVAPSRRQRLHGAIGRALEGRSQGHTGRRLADLAFHFTRNGDSERGIRYACLAAEEAVRTHAPKEAWLHYCAALGLAEQMEGDGLSNRPGRGSLLLGVGEAALQAGLEAEALQACESALVWFRQQQDRQSAARAARGLGRARTQVEDVLAAQEAFILGLELLQDDCSALATQLRVDLANLLVVNRHQYEEGMGHAQRALEIARSLGDKRLTASALHALGNAQVRANRVPAGIAALDEGLAMAMATGSLAEAAEICSDLLVALTWNCSLKRAVEVGEQLIDLVERCQARYCLRHGYSLLALAHIAQGDLVTADRLLEQGAAIVATFVGLEPLAFLRSCQAMLAYVAGDEATMAVRVTQTVGSLRPVGQDGLAWYLGLQALAHLAGGRHAQARSARTDLEMLAQNSPAGTFPAAGAFTHLALFALAAGEQDRLFDLYPELLPFRGQYHGALADRLLGTIEVLLGDWDRAKVSLDAAERVARREQLRWELAHTLAARADLELARGGAQSAMRARALLAEALNIIRAYGNQGEEKRLRARLRDLPRQPGGSPSMPAPAGLSRRELDILRLLAQGKSNREMAGDLALSEKTIANHLTMIFNKIGVENRAAAAAFAVKQGVG